MPRSDKGCQRSDVKPRSDKGCQRSDVKPRSDKECWSYWKDQNDGSLLIEILSLYETLANSEDWKKEGIISSFAEKTSKYHFNLPNYIIIQLTNIVLSNCISK